MFQLEKERNLLLRRRILEKEIEKVQLMIDSLEYWRILSKINDISKKIEENTALKNKLEVELIQVQFEKKKLMEKMEELLKTIQTTGDSNRIRIEYELKDYEKQLNEYLEKIEKGKIEKEKIKRELEKARKKRNDLQRKIKRLSNILITMTEKHSSINTLFSKLSIEKKKLQELEKKKIEEIFSIKSEMNFIEKELERIILEEKSNREMLNNVLAYYDSVKKRIRLLKKAREGDIARRNKLIERLTNLEEVLAERKRALDNALTTLKILTESIDAFRILFAKVSGAIEYRSRNEKDRTIKVFKKILEEKGLRIHGVLKESLWFPESIKKAVESLAGEWMYSILVENSLDMLVLINILGRSIDDVKILTSEGETLRREIPVKLRGRGTHVMDLIKYPKNIEKHVLKIFWNSVLANSIEDALVFAKHGFKAATLDGQVFTNEGASIQKDNDREFESLLRFMKNFTEKIVELSRMIEKVELHIRHSLTKKISEESEFRNRLESELNSIDMHMNELEGQLNVLANEYLLASKKLSQVFRERSLNRKHLFERKLFRLKSLLVLKEKKLISIRRSIKVLEEKIEKIESEKVKEKESLIKIENIIKSLRKRVLEFRDLEKSLIDKFYVIREEMRLSINLANELRNKIETLRGTFGETQMKREEENRRDKLVEAIRKIDEEIERLNSEINRVKDVERKLLVEKEVNENRIEELKSRINGQPLIVSGETSFVERYLNILKEEIEKVQEVNML
ncbi:MAG: hypothetical protein N3A69_09970, partial [Leptospiraceae bacterium]|nr:hypothetical protein [Leptospiraceae bacterium]